MNLKALQRNGQGLDKLLCQISCVDVGRKIAQSSFSLVSAYTEAQSEHPKSNS
jgi:hypothetical protein